MYINTWYELRCPKCKIANLLNMGDITDCTGFDAEGCECYNCSYFFDFEGEEINSDFIKDSCDKGIPFNRR